MIQAGDFVKRAVLASLFVAALVIHGASAEEPIDAHATKCPNGLLFANPNNCSTFYKCDCDNGNTQLFTCPGNLVFDPVLLVCNYLSNVPSCAPVVNCPNGEFYPNVPGSCSGQFWSCDCQNGNKVPMTCPSGLVFDPVLLVCNYPANVAVCGAVTSTTAVAPTTTTITTRVPTTNTPTTTTRAPTTTTASPGSGTTMIMPDGCIVGLPFCTQAGDTFGNYRDDADCTKFWKCSNGCVYHMDCPMGPGGRPLVFNPVIRECDYVDNVPICNGQTGK